MSNKHLITSLLLLTLIMGCTQEQNNNGVSQAIKGNGLVVTNFTSDINNLRINEVTNVKALLFNNGNFEARNITSILYGEGVLERVNEQNFSLGLLPARQDLHFWSLKVPLSLSQTESTSYNVNARIYYLYNFSGFQQVGFVSPTYSGGELPLSSGSSDSPLIVSVDTRNPVRTLYETGTIFTTTILLTNVGQGNVDYFNCSILSNPPCRKNGYLNELRLSVPNDWTPMMDMSAWIIDEGETETTYVLNYDKLETDYINNDCQTQTSENCNLLSEAINHLRLIRGDEVRIVLQFSKPLVEEVTVDSVTVNGDFSYEVDTTDFTNGLFLQIISG